MEYNKRSKEDLIKEVKALNCLVNCLENHTPKKVDQVKMYYELKDICPIADFCLCVSSPSENNTSYFIIQGRRTDLMAMIIKCEKLKEFGEWITKYSDKIIVKTIDGILNISFK